MTTAQTANGIGSAAGSLKVALSLLPSFSVIPAATIRLECISGDAACHRAEIQLAACASLARCIECGQGASKPDSMKQGGAFTGQPESSEPDLNSAPGLGLSLEGRALGGYTVHASLRVPLPYL